MAQGFCGVMKTKPTASASQERVFVAGTGEVDAQIYE
jgi:hypothetical protein